MPALRRTRPSPTPDTGRQAEITPLNSNHIERVRAITVRVIPPETIPLETSLGAVQAEIVQPLVDSGDLVPPYRIQFSGSADDLRRTRQALQWNFLLALVITYLLMAALFESFLYPFVIMLSVPPALAGGILGLEVVNRTLTYQPVGAGHPPLRRTGTYETLVGWPTYTLRSEYCHYFEYPIKCVYLLYSEIEKNADAWLGCHCTTAA